MPPTTALRSLDPARLSRGLVLSLAGGTVLALTGAFGSIAAPLWLRLVYWVPVLVAGAVWGHVCSPLIERWISRDARPWLAVAVLSAAIAGPVSVLVWFVTGLVFGGRISPLSELPHMIGPVLTITAVMCAINVFVARRQPNEIYARVAAPAARFPNRLPPSLRGARILAVRSEDHYLRIHTDRGSGLIHMRLSDALTELEGLEGAQTHRSWWVAKDAVSNVSTGGGRAALTLEDGAVAPVSRRYAKALRDAGWY